MFGLNTNPKSNRNNGRMLNSSLTKEFSSNFMGKLHVSFRLLNNSAQCGRKTIVVTSSTLCHLWRLQTFNPADHVNFDCVIGGKVSDVHKMFMDVYGAYQSPLNVIICAGLNNIPVHTAEETIKQMKAFIQSIHHLNEENSSVFSTLPYAPKFCDESMPNNEIMIEKLAKINKWITNYNMENTGLTLDLSKWGVPIKLKYDEWKEDEIRKKLHLSLFVKKTVAVDLTNLCNALQSKPNRESPPKSKADARFFEHEKKTNYKVKTHEEVVFEQNKILASFSKPNRESPQKTKAHASFFEHEKKSECKGKTHEEVVFEQNKILASFFDPHRESPPKNKVNVSSPYPPGHPLWRWQGHSSVQKEKNSQAVSKHQKKSPNSNQQKYCERQGRPSQNN